MDSYNKNSKEDVMEMNFTSAGKELNTLVVQTAIASEPKIPPVHQNIYRRSNLDVG